MHFRKQIEAYLFFLLRHRIAVACFIGMLTVVLAFFMFTKTRIYTNFFDLYPPNHPYIQLYQEYRQMFGTANTVLVVVEVNDGTIFDSTETVKKVERITLEFLHDIEGVNGEQMWTPAEYRRGLLIGYPTDVRRHPGSCIFVHVWSKPGLGTAGCIGLPAERVEATRSAWNR